MIIIPTEKRFDWKHAPVVLFSLVIINIFIFFIPQSTDDEKVATAFIKYQEESYFNIEWPFLQQYLRETEQLATLEKFEELYRLQQYEPIVGHILFDSAFYRYLRQDQYDYFRQNDVGDWFFIREDIHSLIQSTIIQSYGLVPTEFSLFDTLSYQFLHGNIMHLLGNLFFLVICGFAVEAAIGRWRFLLFYLLCGIFGGVLHVIFNSQSATPLVGASAAISGTMAMYLGLFRLKKIEFFYWLFVFVGYFRAPALLILFFYIGKELYQLLTDNASNVAFLAHVGGFVSGAVLMGIAYKMSPSIFNQEYIEEDQSIDPWQEKKATIYDFLGKYQFDAAAKAIDRVISEQGLNFELAHLRYNVERISIEKISVEKINSKEHFTAHTLELLTLAKLNDQQLDKLESIWQASLPHLQNLDAKAKLRVALNLAESRSPKAAMQIVDELGSDSSLHPHLAIISKKLSATFAKENNISMQKKYLQLQQHFLSAMKT